MKLTSAPGQPDSSITAAGIGHTVEARQHPSAVEVLYGGRVRCTMPRLRGAADRRIDYRRIIPGVNPQAGCLSPVSLLGRAVLTRKVGHTAGGTDAEYARPLHLTVRASERQVEATLGLDSPSALGATTAAFRLGRGRQSPAVPVV